MHMYSATINFYDNQCQNIIDYQIRLFHKHREMINFLRSLKANENRYYKLSLSFLRREKNGSWSKVGNNEKA